MRAVLFSLTLLLSSFLLFLVQPMVGRMLLPSLGGTPAVWNGCMLFFQATLLAGYAWAHYGPQRLGTRNHLLIHLSMLGVVCLILPIQLWSGWSVPVDGNPLGWLLGQLFLCVGAPFFVVSSNAPLLQRWFSISGDDGDDSEPWFLYAISNVGSLAALIGYPLIFERWFGLTDQGYIWMSGFLALVILFAVCAWQVLKRPTTGGSKDAEVEHSSAVPIAWKSRLHYIALAAIPSSLMLGVTTVVSTEVGSFPLMWSIPLALYLITFVFVFARRQLIPHTWMIRLMPLMLLLMPMMAIADMGHNPMVMIGVHFATFFVVSMVCHGELSRLRPDVSQLTEFYLLMSIGGVVGGIVNSLLAPMLFSGTIEYPLALIAACFAVPTMHTLLRSSSQKSAQTDDLAKPQPQLSGSNLVVPGVIAVLLVTFAVLSNLLAATPDTVHRMIVFGVPAILCFTLVSTPRRFAIGYAMVAIGCPLLLEQGDLICQHRGFFGVNKVTEDPDANFRMLINGRTLHGMQRIDQTERPDPLSYYHADGPVGDMFELFGNDQKRIAAVGLGVGSLAAWSEPGQRFDFFEIDPVVYQLANNPDYFNYLSTARGDVRVILGDARIQLEAIRNQNMISSRQLVSLDETTGDVMQGSAPDPRYDVVMLDAFGSDAVPIHLITTEAIELYLELLADDGLLMMHVSSKFIDLVPVAAAIGEKMNLSVAQKYHRPSNEAIKQDGIMPSRYIILSRNRDLVESFVDSERGWQWLPEDRKLLWTDEHANVLDAMFW